MRIHPYAGRCEITGPSYRAERPAGFGYRPAEHAGVAGKVIQQLDLHDLIVMGHDWGGPTGLSAAADNADRVSGLVLGNTAFWSADRMARLFSWVMSTRFMQRRILHKTSSSNASCFPT